jgi:Holliday junction resolvase
MVKNYMEIDMGKRESVIQKEIMDYLKSEKWFVIRNHTQGLKYTGGRSTNPNKGMCDLLAIKDGKYIWIEVKTLSGVVSKYQIEWMKNAKRYGARILVADCVYDVKEFIKDF